MGPGSRTLEHLDCPECGTPTPVKLQGGNDALVFLYCPACMPRCLVLGKGLPGLPSDLTYLRAEGPRLLEEAMEEMRDEIQARREAGERAEVLLKQHLSHDQLPSYTSHGWFDVASRYTDEVVYRIADEKYKTSVVVIGCVEGGIRDFVTGLGRLPGLGLAIREAAANAFRENGSVRLCLHLLGGRLPNADSALAFKLYAEANEVQLWIKGTRMHLGLRPEVLTFTEVAS